MCIRDRRRIEQWAKARGVAVELTGLDLNPDTSAVAAEASPATSKIQWISADIFEYTPRRPVHLVVKMCIRDRATPVLPRVAKPTVNSPVTLTDNGDSWTMDNGIVKMSLLKRNGNMTSLVYHGVEILTHGQYWEQTPAGTITARVTIDPATNGGERAEVSVKGVYNAASTQAADGAADCLLYTSRCV